jgi:hypothetical protein
MKLFSKLAATVAVLAMLAGSANADVISPLSKPQSGAVTAVEPQVSATGISNVVIKASIGGTLYSLITDDTAAGYVFVFDAGALPDDGVVAGIANSGNVVYWGALAANTPTPLGGPPWIVTATGLTVACSSTAFPQFTHATTCNFQYQAL